ncbi:MAG: DUF917 domain-containing protein [Chloroflexi bacterium]|nr:DUF917 domain-containing protein [Chloroflexota bacterium]
MAIREIKTEQEAQDFVRGCAFYGTGGGGLVENGIKSLMTLLNNHKKIKFISTDDVADDEYIACTFLMGSIAPLTEETIKEMKTFGLEKEKYTDSETLAEAVKELELFSGKKVKAIVPIELGGANTPGGVAASVLNDVPVIDGDFTGRAIPEIQQTTPYLKGKDLCPISSVDLWGNVCIVKNAINYFMSERIGKIISTSAYSLTGDAGFLMTGKDMRECIIPGTLTECYELGKLIRETREKNENPVQAIVKKLNAKLLFEGEVVNKETENKGGYYWGTTTVEKAGSKCKVWFKNENHMCWIDDKVVCTSPDMISLVNSETGEPITNPKMAVGMKVSVIGVGARKEFMNEKGIDILGPKYFGFDEEYKPLMSK